MTSTTKTVRLMVLMIVAAAWPAAAQTTLGTIRGTVFDQQQNIVPGVSVVVTDEATGVTREAQTDTQGLYEIPNLRPGTYSVTASLSGFKKVQRTGIVLRAASTALADVHLDVGGLESVVAVGFSFGVCFCVGIDAGQKAA